MIYSYPYIILIIFFLAVTVFQLGVPIEEKSRKYINYLVVIVFVLFFGFRGFIGWDWYNYYPFFKSIELDNNVVKGATKSGFEFGFYLYSYLLKYIFKTYDAFVLISTLINAILLYIFFNRYLSIKYIAFGFALFVGFGGLLFEVDLMRNVKSLLLYFLAIPYILQRKPIKYLLLIAIAFLFHWSALFFIPLYFFLHRPIDLKFFLIVVVIGNLIFLIKVEYVTGVINSIIHFFPEAEAKKISIYLGSKIFSKSYGFTFGYIERTITTLFVLIYYNKLIRKPENILFVNSFIIYISLFLYGAEITIILGRVAAVFAYSYWILIPAIINEIDKNSKILVFSFYCLILVMKVNVMTNNIFYSYQSTLLNNKNSYSEQLKIYNAHKVELQKNN